MIGNGPSLLPLDLLHVESAARAGLDGKSEVRHDSRIRARARIVLRLPSLPSRGSVYR